MAETLSSIIKPLFMLNADAASKGTVILVFTEVDYQEKRKMYREHQHAILNAMNFCPFDNQAKAWLQVQLENLAAKHTQPAI